MFYRKDTFLVHMHAIFLYIYRVKIPFLYFFFQRNFFSMFNMFKVDNFSMVSGMAEPSTKLLLYSC